MKMKEKIVCKTMLEVAKMRVAGRLASQVLDYITPYVVTGITTNELDRLCHEFITKHNAIPAPLNYCPPGHPIPYPKATCISLNHVVCHGIPSERVLKNTDILNIDVTVIKDDYHGDCSRMYTVGVPNVAAKRICEAAHLSMWAGIAVIKPGAYMSDIGRAIQRFCDTHGYSVVRDFCGHGIGRFFHEPPQVLHYATNERDPIELKEGMTFTVEPMINIGRYRVKVLPDYWTVVTADHSLSAQWEHTILVTETGYEVLTISEGARLPPTQEEYSLF